ncbi:MAG: hypothetical protein A2X13_00425 [Bacteroidetes bacterium GWC2_33_15]|nr:MAG: hypothetical protein A2X10_04235 [Bacteroidetes bacterium GWA2_33_15]OFX51088.1 MAG: hypothetical protein A2X13_00425 [Bacteroidetes bacterium GWC2_33_15]OFX66479.1 MAG: hypothetical protein A2X15_07530 [Bacteroidetes bacterium GWB2_32_14]OFX70296.1 MAG: hypothetical protein A2X14_03315 [Bacteroidetes bacterium GWD2_33_33]HAN17294.1 hypothetical protein [Bacteroidales bacterium]
MLQKKIDIVVVIKNSNLVTEIQKQFNPDSYNLNIFFSGKEAYSFLINSNSSNLIVILNNNLPELKGLELARILKKEEKSFSFIFLIDETIDKQIIETIRTESFYFINQTSDFKKELIPLIHEIENQKSKQIEDDALKFEFENYKKRIQDLERDVDFYVKQGDIITKQRTKIQKERDQLAIEKSEIAKQKELMETDLQFIMKQGDKIAEQKHKIKIQHDLVQQQKQKITDSIVYAKRIQSAILPPNRFIQHLLAEHFIFYKPRDIVSGDFYWIKQVDNRICIAAADCTGHGVPGALMSMLGITFLNEIINKDPKIRANEILNELRTHVISSLRQTGKTGESRDGMDIALCIINHDSKTLEFAGANNHLYMIRDGELTEIKADRMPIGIHQRAKEPFTNNEIKLEKDDLIYIFSDGFVDQFGGPDGRKFLATNFKKLLLENHQEHLTDQKQILENTFENWRGEFKQLDDILVIGFKIAFTKSYPKSKDSYDWEGKVILIAEDDEANYMLLERALSKTKATLIRAENGKEAVKIFKSIPGIDVILMDIRMPLMDGIEATQEIKEIDSKIPIIVQTAFTMSSEKEKSFKAGCDDYISKPINLKELLATVSKYIDRE